MENHYNDIIPCHDCMLQEKDAHTTALKKEQIVIQQRG